MFEKHVKNTFHNNPIDALNPDHDPENDQEIEYTSIDTSEYLQTS